MVTWWLLEQYQLQTPYFPHECLCTCHPRVTNFVSDILSFHLKCQILGKRVDCKVSWGNSLGMMEMFYSLTVVSVIQLHTAAKSHQMYIENWWILFHVHYTSKVVTTKVKLSTCFWPWPFSYWGCCVAWLCFTHSHFPDFSFLLRTSVSLFPSPHLQPHPREQAPGHLHMPALRRNPSICIKVQRIKHKCSGVSN